MNISNTNKNLKFYFHMNYKFSITCVDCWNILTFIYLNLPLRHNDKKWTKHCFVDLMKWNRNKITNDMKHFVLNSYQIWKMIPIKGKSIVINVINVYGNECLKNVFHKKNVYGNQCFNNVTNIHFKILYICVKKCIPRSKWKDQD
jgi:hypothetical protein